MNSSLAAVLVAVAFFVFASGCKEASDVTTVDIIIDGLGCNPATVAVEAGRVARLRIDNASTTTFTVRDSEGRLQETTIAAGESVDRFYDVPEGDAKYILQCEGANGVYNSIALRATTGFIKPTKDVAPDGDTLAVTLLDFETAVSAPTIAGRHTFIATNVSETSTHDLHIMQLQPDGTHEDVGRIAPIAPQQGGSVTVDLEPGTYRLACLIEAGEFGSTDDHYQQGMWLDIDVRPAE